MHEIVNRQGHDGNEIPSRSNVKNDQPPGQEAPEGQSFVGECGYGKSGESWRNQREDKRTYSTPSQRPPTTTTSSTSTPRTSSTTTATTQIPRKLLEFVWIIIGTRVRPPRAGMHKAAIFPRVTYTDPFFVKVLDVWRAGNERGLSTKSREIVGWACTGVSFLGE